MESFKMIIVIVVGLLGALSFFTGIGAEATKVKYSQIEIGSGYCWYPASPATALGFTAAVALLVGQIIINVASGCFCCRRLIGNANTTKLRWFSVLSWVAFFLAMRLFLAGININDGSVRGRGTAYYDGLYYTCYYVKTGVFVSGSFLSALSLMLGLFCYVAYYTKDQLTVPAGVGNIPMANPQFGPGQAGIPMPMGNNNDYNPQFPSNYNNKPPQPNFGQQM